MKLTTVLNIMLLLMFTSIMIVINIRKDSFIPNAQKKVISVAEKTGTKIQNITTEYDSGIKEFGLGVYYFPQIGSDFGKQLCFFLESHTNLEVSAIAGDVARFNRSSGPQRDYGATIGYFVTFREKK